MAPLAKLGNCVIIVCVSERLMSMVKSMLNHLRGASQLEHLERSLRQKKKALFSPSFYHLDFMNCRCLILCQCVHPEILFSSNNGDGYNLARANKTCIQHPRMALLGCRRRILNRSRSNFVDVTRVLQQLNGTRRKEQKQRFGGYNRSPLFVLLSLCVLPFSCPLGSSIPGWW